MWREVRVGDIGTVITGATPKTSEGSFWGGDIPFISPADFSNSSQYVQNTEASLTFKGARVGREIPRHAILVTCIGSLGKMAISNYERASFNQQINAVVCSDNFNPYYLFHLLQHDVNKLVRLSGATTIQIVNKSLFETIKLMVPNRKVQDRIATVFEIADSALEKTQALIAKYENIKKGMMQDLFTRGVDENGQLRPSYQEAPNIYQETEIGWIPNDWAMEELRYFVPKAEYGVSISCDDNAENVPVLRMNNIFNGEFNVSDLKYAPKSELTGLFMKEKDVLFNRTNSWEHVGKTAIWKNQLEKASFASYMVRLIPNIDLMIPEYLSYWLQLDDVQTAIRRFATPGVQQVNINPTNLRRTLCSAPKDTTEQSMIVSRVQSIDEKLEKERLILTKLQSQKLGLMQDLLTGKVRVAEDIEERKEAVA